MLKRDTLQSLLLLIEAVLIIIALAMGSRTTVGMICYWSIVAVNHLTDFIIRRIEEKENREDKGNAERSR